MVARRKKVDTGPERQVLIGMITSDVFLAELVPMFQEAYLQSEYAKTVSRWCIDHFQTFGKAPGVHIQDIFESNKRNGLNEDTADLVATFLESISEEYERAGQFNVEFMLKEAEKTFKARAMSMLAEDVTAYLSQGNQQDAELLLTKFIVPERRGNDWMDPFGTADAISEAFKDDGNEKLFTMPGALGQLMGPLERDSLISLMGPEKRGKTWWQIEFAMRGLRNRCNVAFFEIGDMTPRQMQRRFYSYLCQASLRQAGKEILQPVLDCQLNQLCTCESKDWLDRSANPGSMDKTQYKLAGYTEHPDHVPCTVCAKRGLPMFRGSHWWRPFIVPGLAENPTIAKAEEFMKKVGESRLRLVCQPADSVSAEWIDKQLELWYRRDGWLADLVIIDYADNLAPVNAKKEERHAINQTWQWLRRISQTKNCCVLTATQAGRSSYGKATVGAQDTSEDKRKLAHVNAMYALNQLPEEKAAGVMRISNIIVREDDYDVRQNVNVLQCLAIGRPYMASYF